MGREDGFKDLYEILGVPRTADGETLRSAYRSRARALHPDVSRAPDAEDRYRELSHAYDVLSKPRSRLLYDRLAYRASVRDGVAAAAGDSPDVGDDELIDWIFTDDRADTAAPARGEDRLMRALAALGLLVAVVLVAVLLFARV